MLLGWITRSKWKLLAMFIISYIFHCFSIKPTDSPEIPKIIGSASTSSDSPPVQAQLREVTLQEENAVYESTISCENKIQEKIQEEDLLKRKLMTDSLHTLSVSVILDSVLPLLLLKKPNCRTSLLFTSQPHHTKVQDKRRFDEFQLLERSWFLGIFS
ncbi:uncharacterized protein [Malus domestica]|uniref:uncharacterized protein isoform X2 n=1 Tax=Malus domestica TaxID=3750 RepID=UPI003976EFBC